MTVNSSKSMSMTIVDVGLAKQFQQVLKLRDLLYDKVLNVNVAFFPVEFGADCAMEIIASKRANKGDTIDAKIFKKYCQNIYRKIL